MIKIIQGTFGLRVNNTIVPKSAKDEPFSCDETTEKRLVKIGVAEFVEEAEAIVEVQNNEVVTEETETEAEATEETETEAEVVIENVSKEELIAMFKELGLKGNPAVMKEETLKAKIAEAAKLVEDEEAPVFDEAGGVVQ